MQILVDESLRVADVAHNAHVIIDDIDHEFERRTALNKLDMTFLFIATALQCVRWYFLSNDAFRLDKASDGDRLMAAAVPKKWHDILLRSVPYDAVKRAPGFVDGTGLSGTTHRYRTLGHDPVLGWVFGPLNILTDSATKYDLTSYSVQNMMIAGPMPTPEIFTKGMEQVRLDPLNLPAAVARQAIHFGSDYFTKQGLPLPMIGTVDNDLAKTLMTRFNVDLMSVMRGAAAAILINSIISFMHQLFYDEARDGSKKLYEVRTKKILSYSNLIASSSNILYVAIGSALGNAAALKRLDVGGFCVTLYRLFADIRFRGEIKREFLAESFNEKIRGDIDYSRFGLESS